MTAGPALAPIVLTGVSESQTRALGVLIGTGLRMGDVVALWGDLGAGKTTFTRALVRARLGDPDREVPSPTYSLMQIYEAADLRIAHVDCYRLSGAEEVYDLGLEEVVADGALIVEWPASLGVLAQRRLDVRFRFSVAGDGARDLHVEGHEFLEPIGKDVRALGK